MPTTKIPDGVTVELLEDGHWVEHSGTRSWGSKKRIRVDRLWVVRKDDQVIGHIRYRMITREQRTPGRVYVNSRWQSPGFEYQDSEEVYTSIHSGRGYWGEAFSKSDAIERLVWAAERKEREAK